MAISDDGHVQEVACGSEGGVGVLLPVAFLWMRGGKGEGGVRSTDSFESD
jgi:hypothetical protein